LKENLPKTQNEVSTEKLSVIIQKLDEEDTVKKNDIVLEIQLWLPSASAFGPREELIIKDTSNIHELKIMLESKMAEKNITIKVAKPMRFQLRDPEGLMDLNWDIPEDCILCSSPWYLQSGDFLLYRDGNASDFVVVTEGGEQVRKQYIPRKEVGIKIDVLTNFTKEDNTKKEDSKDEKKDNEEKGNKST